MTQLPPNGQGWSREAGGGWFPGFDPVHGRPAYPIAAPAWPDPSWPRPSPGQPRRRRPSATLVLSVLVVVLIAFGAAVYVARTVGQHPQGASATLTAAVGNTIADRTADMSVTTSVSLGSQTITATGSGVVDFGDNSSEVELSTQALGQRISEQSISVGGTVYVDPPGVSTVVPGKSWISIDIGNASAGPSGLTSGSAAEGTGDNPAGMLQLLRQRGATVTALGPSTVTGVPVQGYSVTFSPTQIQTMLNSASVPAWLRGMLSTITVGGIDDHVYIDGSGHLRLVTMNFTETVGGSRTVTMHQSFELSDYGLPVTITAPPAIDVVTFSTFLKAVELGGSGSTATA